MQRTYNISANYDLFYYEPAGSNNITINFPDYQGNVTQRTDDWSHLEYSFDGQTWYKPEPNSSLTVNRRTYVQMTYGKTGALGILGRNCSPATITSGKYNVGGNAKTYHKRWFRNDTNVVSAKNLRGYENDLDLSYFFDGCTSLEETFDLTQTESYWNHQINYEFMFRNCTSLKRCKIAEIDYPETESSLEPNMNGMFVNCVNLEVLPKLTYPETHNSRTYQSMFYGCSKIKLSTIQTGEYQTPYKIPYGYSTVLDPSVVGNALDDMFTNTGGTFTGTPT